MNANPNIAARDQLRAAIAVRTEAEHETTTAKVAVDRAAQLIADLDAKLKATDAATATSVRKIAQHLRKSPDAPPLPPVGRTDLIDQIDVARKVSAQLEAEHAAAADRQRTAEHAAARYARAAMNADAESLVIALEDLHARKREIEAVLHGLAECGARLISEPVSGPFPLPPRAVAALNPPCEEYLDTHTRDPRAPRAAASARWNRFFKALLRDADAKFGE